MFRRRWVLMDCGGELGWSRRLSLLIGGFVVGRASQGMEYVGVLC